MAGPNPLDPNAIVWDETPPQSAAPDPAAIQWDEAPAPEPGIVGWGARGAAARGFTGEAVGRHLGGLADVNIGSIIEGIGGAERFVGEAPGALQNYLTEGEELRTKPRERSGNYEGGSLWEFLNTPTKLRDPVANRADSALSDADYAAATALRASRLDTPEARSGAHIAALGREQRERGAAASRIERPESLLDDPLGAIKYYANQAAGSALPMAAAMVQPTAGLALFGVEGFGSEYEKRRAEGRGVGEAATSGIVHGAAEVIPERLSLNILRGEIGKGLTGLLGERAAKSITDNFASRIVAGAAAEGGSEVVTQATQDLYDKFVNGDALTREQILRNLVDSFWTGGVAGAGFGAAHLAAGRAHDLIAGAPVEGAPPAAAAAPSTPVPPADPGAFLPPDPAAIMWDGETVGATPGAEAGRELTDPADVNAALSRQVTTAFPDEEVADVQGTDALRALAQDDPSNAERNGASTSALPQEPAASDQPPPVRTQRFDPDSRAQEAAGRDLSALVAEAGLSPEQAEIVRQRTARAAPRDRVTSLYRAEELDPTILAVQDAAEPGVYVEADMTNLGGANARLGTSGADPLLAEFASTVREALEPLGAAVGIRKGGDELGFIVTGATRQQVDAAMSAAREKFAASMAEKGYADIPHPKGGAAGIGLHFGTSDIAAGVPIREILRAADTQVEARKKGAAYEQREAVEAPRAGGDAGVGTAGGTVARGKRGARARGVGAPVVAARESGEGGGVRREGGEAGEVVVAEPDDYESRLYSDAAEYVRSGGDISVDGLQREFQIRRGATIQLLRDLEAGGVVSPMDARGRRTAVATIPAQSEATTGENNAKEVRSNPRQDDREGAPGGRGENVRGEDIQRNAQARADAGDAQAGQEAGAVESAAAAAEDDTPEPLTPIQYGKRRLPTAPLRAATPETKQRRTMPEAAGQSVDDVRATVADLTKTWRNAPPIEVLASPADAPVKLDDDAAGAYVDGNVYLFANNLTNAEHGQFVALHEALGHHGLLGTLGPKLRPVMRTIYATNAKVRAAAQKWMRENDSTDVELATEEAMADMAAADLPKLSGWKRFVAAVKDALRRAGFSLDMSDADIAALLTRAAGYVRDGTTQFGRSQGAKYHKAWHGTPHDVDRFSTDRIGTGEGAQAFGHGLYFAARKEVAEHYRQQLSITERELQDLASPYAGLSDSRAIEKLLQASRQARLNGHNKDAVDYEQTAKWVDAGRPKRGGGNIYEVDLAPSESDYLDWDSPLSEQSESVQSALSSLGISVDAAKAAEQNTRLAALNRRIDRGGAGADEAMAEKERIIREEPVYDKTGEDIYKEIDSDPSKASRKLHEAGIPGIKYLDGGSRGSGPGGTYNYVIFDDSNVKVVAKYSKRDVTETPEFKRWFGDSKVVDEKGEPLVVYHAGSFHEDDGAFRTEGGVHFGTEQAALDRTVGKFVDDIVKSADVYEEDGRYFVDDNEWPQAPSSGFGSEESARSWLAGEANEMADYDPLENNMTAVFLSIKNPKRIEDQGDEWNAAVKAAKAEGHDGIVYKNKFEDRGSESWIAFRPEQIKSATGNAGSFDPANPDIRYSKAAAKSLGVKQPAAGAASAFDGYTLPTESFKRAYAEAVGGPIRKFVAGLRATGRNLRRTFADDLLPLLQVETTIKELGNYAGNLMNTYQRAELFHGRAGDRIRKFRKEQLEPFLKDFAKTKLTFDELESFLYAKFAPRRNEIIRDLHAGTPKADKFADGGSGMADKDAADILDTFRKEGKYDELEKFAKRVYAMSAERIDTLESSGLISKETADEWRKEPAYVPLKDFADEREIAFEGRGVGRGKGFSVGGPESLAARGRTSRAANLLENTIAQIELAHVRAEKNAVAQSLASLVLANPNKSLWEIARVKAKPVRDPVTGEILETDQGNKVFTFEKARDTAPDIINAKVDGNTIAIRLKGNGGEALATAFKNLGASQLGPFMQSLRTISRYISLLRTSWNPEFVLSNFARDVQTAFSNLDVEQSGKFARSMVRLIKPSLSAAFRSEAELKKHPVLGQYYEDFLADGGKTDYANLRTVEEITKDIGRMMARSQRGVYNPKRIARRAWEWFEAANTAVENASRLAAYTVARQNGMARKDAASLAKNLTVNFNRHGTAGPTLNALWNFTNASIQGNARFAQFIAKNPKRAVTRVVMPLFGLGFALSMLNGWLGGDDEDGEERWAKVPDFERNRNLILMVGDQKVKIPMPYTYNLPFVVGSRIADVVAGRSKSRTAGAQIAESVLNAANPLGESPNVVAFVAPTLLDPFVEILANENFAGRPIRPENAFDRSPEPDSQKAWESTPDPWKWIAEGLNSATGGSAVRPGAIDVSPTTLDHMFKFALGGVGSFLGRAWNSTAGAAIKGELPEPNQIPFLRTVYGRANDRQVRTDFYAFEKDAGYRVEDAKLAAAEKRTTDAPADLVREWEVADAKLAPAIKAADAQLRKLRDARKKAKAAGDDAEAKEIETKIRDVQAEFNRKYVDALRSIDEPIR